jgi:hypothetical protein
LQRNMHSVIGDQLTVEFDGRKLWDVGHVGLICMYR